MNKLIAVVLFTFCITIFTIAQTTPKLQDPTNQFIIDKAFEIAPGGGLIYFKSNELHPGELFTDYYTSTGLSALDFMVLVNTTHDEMLEDEDSPAPNLYHALYQQYYNSIKVEGALYTEHHDGSCVWFTSGFVIEGLDLSVTPEISKSAALEYAVHHIGSESYEWDSSAVDTIVELILVPICDGESYSASNYKLAWKFTIIGFNPDYYKDIYVDANNGDILKEVSNEHEGDFNHIYYGFKDDMDTRYKNMWWTWDRWYLAANDNSRNILTTDHTYYHDPRFYVQDWNYDDMNFSSDDDHWGDDHWSATSAHYCVSKSWDYFKQTALNRNGMTGWGSHVRVIADYPFNNAKYSKVAGQDHIRVGRINNYYLATYDIMGHEFTHGVTENSRPLKPEQISGAIDESFADIFGFMVERYAIGYVKDWTIGEDANNASRNLQFPNSYNQPSYYLQSSYWVNPTSISNDAGGIHVNSGVMNHWFYLLSMGGSQSIFGQTRSVNGIGIDKAARIAYYTLTNFNNTSPLNKTFDAVRDNSIAAARKLYGICSYEYNQTCAAWYAVNVSSYCEACSYASSWCGQEQSISSSVKERKKEVLNIRLFPNPANDKITIYLEESKTALNQTSYQLNISDVNGKLVYSSTYSNLNNTNIDINSLKSGVYFVSISTDNWVKNIKFVKN